MSFISKFPSTTHCCSFILPDWHMTNEIFLSFENLFFMVVHFSLRPLVSFLCLYKRSLYIKAIDPYFFSIWPYLGCFAILIFFGLGLIELNHLGFPSCLEKAFLHENYINVYPHFNALWCHILDLNLCTGPSLSWCRDWIIGPVLFFLWLTGHPNPIYWVIPFSLHHLQWLRMYVWCGSSRTHSLTIGVLGPRPVVGFVLEHSLSKYILLRGITSLSYQN